MHAAYNEISGVELTLYTDALITHGTVRTSRQRVTDILNLAEDPFLVLEDVLVEELGTRGEPIRAGYAQVNLDAVLFAVVERAGGPDPELRTPKMQEQAILSVPPFSIVGTIHLLPGGGDLREALTELTGRFIPVTDAMFWSDRAGEARQQAVLLAVNHRRTQILAQYKARRPLGRPQPPELQAAVSGTRQPSRPQRLGPYAVHRQVQAVAPLGPAAVVDRHVLVAEQGQDVGELRRGDARPVVADEAAAAGDVRLEQERPQLARIAQPLRCPAGASRRPAR